PATPSRPVRCGWAPDSSRVRVPERAERTAAAAAVVVVPAPPGPVNRWMRAVCPVPATSALDALLELLERRVEDDPLGLALQHADQRHVHVDGDRVGHLG